VTADGGSSWSPASNCPMRSKFRLTSPVGGRNDCPTPPKIRPSCRSRLGLRDRLAYHASLRLCRQETVLQARRLPYLWIIELESRTVTARHLSPIAGSNWAAGATTPRRASSRSTAFAQCEPLVDIAKEHLAPQGRKGNNRGAHERTAPRSPYATSNYCALTNAAPFGRADAVGRRSRPARYSRKWPCPRLYAVVAGGDVVEGTRIAIGERCVGAAVPGERVNRGHQRARPGSFRRRPPSRCRRRCRRRRSSIGHRGDVGHRCAWWRCPSAKSLRFSYLLTPEPRRSCRRRCSRRLPTSRAAAVLGELGAAHRDNVLRAAGYCAPASARCRPSSEDGHARVVKVGVVGGSAGVFAAAPAIGHHVAPRRTRCLRRYRDRRAGRIASTTGCSRSGTPRSPPRRRARFRRPIRCPPRIVRCLPRLIHLGELRRGQAELRPVGRKIGGHVGIVVGVHDGDGRRPAAGHDEKIVSRLDI